MKNLLIDLGNTRAKACEEQGGAFYDEFNEASAEALLAALQATGRRYGKCLVCSVTDESPILPGLRQLAGEVQVLSAQTPLPVRLGYESPATLGPDRIAAVVGAWSLQPGRPALVIDLGTAVTYDLIDAMGVYLGGNIAPGVRLRLEALHEKTGRLPLVTAAPAQRLVATTTSEAILNGVMQGIRFEIEGYRRALSKKYPSILTFLTGGDAKFFEIPAKSGIFVVPNLTLVGMSYIINRC